MKNKKLIIFLASLFALGLTNPNIKNFKDFSPEPGTANVVPSSKQYKKKYNFILFSFFEFEYAWYYGDNPSGTTQKKHYYVGVLSNFFEV